MNIVSHFLEKLFSIHENVTQIGMHGARARSVLFFAFSILRKYQQSVRRSSLKGLATLFVRLALRRGAEAR